MFRKKPNLDEIHRYTEDLVKLTNLRDRVLQKAILEDSDVSQQKLLEEYDRYITIVECAQKVLERLLEKDYHKQKENT